MSQQEPTDETGKSLAGGVSADPEIPDDDATVATRSIPTPTPSSSDEATVAASPVTKTTSPATELLSGPQPGAPNSLTVATQHSSATTVAVSTPKQAMRADEERRMRVFIWFAGSMGIVSCIITPMMPGAQDAVWVYVASAITALTAIVLQVMLHRGKPYRPWMGALIGICAATAVNCGYYYYGVNSAIVLVIPIGTFFYALGEDFRFAIFVHVYITLGHAIVSLLLILGVVEDVGLVRTIGGSTAQQVFMVIGLQTVFLGTFWMARSIRYSSRATLEHLDGAVRDIAQREALLNEAKEDLARANRVGGPGRFSDQVFGNFKLGDVLGRGGMGEVYEAVHIESGELAAVKILLREAMTKPDLVARFMREVDIASSVSVENVVRVLEIPDAEAPIPYLAMERLVGETLSDRLRKRPRRKVAEVGVMVRQVGAGIGAAHKAGIVHRDLKPQNIFRHTGESGKTWKILDFGVSKLLDDSGTLTNNQMVGTPTYMAPEQARGEDVDTRTDLYALGIITYRMLTGRPPFSGRDLPTILLAVSYDMPPQPSEIAPIDAAFDSVLAIAIAKSPDDRFASVEEFVAAFGQAQAQTLSDDIVARARGLVERHPWGTRID